MSTHKFDFTVEITIVLENIVQAVFYVYVSKNAWVGVARSTPKAWFS